MRVNHSVARLGRNAMAYPTIKEQRSSTRPSKHVQTTREYGHDTGGSVGVGEDAYAMLSLDPVVSSRCKSLELAGYPPTDRRLVRGSGPPDPGLRRGHSNPLEGQGKHSLCVSRCQVFGGDLENPQFWPRQNLEKLGEKLGYLGPFWSCRYKS